MKTKICILLFFIALSNLTFGQEWIYYEFTFDISEIKNEKELDSISFKYIDGARTEVNAIIFNTQKKQFKISYLTMGGGPILVLVKDTKKMHILLEGDARNLTFSEFKKGFFKPNDSSLIVWNDIDRYIDWINDNELKELEIIISAETGKE